MGTSSKEFDNVGVNDSRDGDRPAAASGEFQGKYKLGVKLGAGTFSVVKLVTVKVGPEMGAQYACKIIDKAGLNQEDKDALKIEIEILKELNHPNIMRLIEVMEDSKKHYLITELLDGGELFDRIVDKALYNEKEARDVVKILLEVMVYCHDRNVVHRDLKVRPRSGAGGAGPVVLDLAARLVCCAWNAFRPRSYNIACTCARPPVRPPSCLPACLPLPCFLRPCPCLSACQPACAYARLPACPPTPRCLPPPPTASFPPSLPPSLPGPARPPAC
jgi:hypothetical protein